MPPVGFTGAGVEAPTDLLGLFEVELGVIVPEVGSVLIYKKKSEGLGSRIGKTPRIRDGKGARFEEGSSKNEEALYIAELMISFQQYQSE